MSNPSLSAIREAREEAGVIGRYIEEAREEAGVIGRYIEEARETAGVIDRYEEARVRRLANIFS